MSRDMHPLQAAPWRSLEEARRPSLSEAEQEALAREFPLAYHQAETDGNRRDFLRVMGASLGLAGLGACVRQPEEKILPYVKQPEDLIPGKPAFYATTFEEGGYGVGLVAESHLGRPTHLEGNREHPGSVGATDVRAQASVLSLWDPDRSKSVMRRGKIASWGMFAKELSSALSKVDGRKGSGLRILTPTVSSPTLASQLESLLLKLPEAKWHQWEPMNRDAAREGSILAFGAPKEVRYVFSRATRVLALDADLVNEAPGHIAYAKYLVGARGRGQTKNRIYAVESSPTSTGAVADHRMRLSAQQMGPFLLDVAHALGVAGVAVGNSPLAERAQAVARDLASAGRTAVVAVGDHLPAEVHALALAVNHHLGAIDHTVRVTRPVAASSVNQRASIEDLAQAMDAGRVEVLVVLGGNPVYDAPGDLGFEASYRDKVPFRVHLGTHFDETARLSQWHLPMSHSLETWADTRAYDGTLSFSQPLIAPIYDSRCPLEVVPMLLGQYEEKASKVLRAHYQKQWKGDFERRWNRALHDGLVDGTRFRSERPALLASAARAAIPAPQPGLEVVLRPCPNVWDGRYANNAWLQETPRPLSRVVWDNMFLISPATAERLKLDDGALIRVTADGRTVEGPAWVMPGAADDSLTVHLGYGRRTGGRVLEGVGFDAYPLLGQGRIRAGATVETTGRTAKVVTVQDHWTLHGRNHVRHATAAEREQNPGFAQAPAKKVLPLNLYPEIRYEGRAWGMVIDLGACTGCNACMVACQSENNVPVVGKAQVAKGREMHWIRIDRYCEGTPEDPSFHFQPLTCMHCERAPCEPVCPANATVHGPEGLNQMVYNRCVGTRYCSNNCPYKVRRFNFHLYADFETESLKGQRNPDVTVRSRGVMEKCTYCIQRIKEASITARVADQEKLPDGAVVTACQSACPTEAIVFGDLNDAESRVAKLKAMALNYTVLEELNTAPRTSYLAAVTNPNPEVVG